MTRAATERGGRDLLGAFDYAASGPPPAATARLILDVMRRMSRAATASLYREQAGTLRWIAGRRLREAALRPIRTALRHDRGGARFSSIWIAEPGADGWERSWVLWSGRPHDTERDVVYMEGPSLRPMGDCSAQLQRLMALLGPLL